MATHSSIFAWRISWTERPTAHRVAESDTTEVTAHSTGKETQDLRDKESDMTEAT